MGLFSKKSAPGKAPSTERGNMPAARGLEPSQGLAYELVPKDSNGNPFQIIARTTVSWSGEQYQVDVYNDTENNKGAVVLPDGTRGNIRDDSYANMLTTFNSEAEKAAREEISGSAEDTRKKSKSERAEEKRRERADAEAETNVNYRKEQKKKTLSLALYVIAVVAVLMVARLFLNAQQDTVSVIRLKTDMLSGDVLSASDIEEYSMLKKTYDTLGQATYMSDGKQVTTQTMLTWDKRDEVIGKYMTAYTQAGQILTSRHITDETTTRNPWLALATAGQEVYTMSFNASDVNTSLLYPGCHMRVRLVVTAQNDGSISAPINTSSSADGETAASAADFIDNISSIAGNTEGVNIINEGTVTKYSSEVPVVELVFSDLQAIDMINSANQSIYELYMALLRLPLDQRTDYLNTRLQDNETANQFRSMVTPSRLVFLLTKEQADMLAQFENLPNADFKFTILLTEDENDNIVSSFIDISSQINTALHENSN